MQGGNTHANDSINVVKKKIDYIMEIKAKNHSIIFNSSNHWILANEASKQRQLPKPPLRATYAIK